MLFILSFLISFSVSASPDLEKLAYSPKWLRLLHYKKTLTGNFESQADGKDFFLHEKGKWDPLLELKRSFDLFSAVSTPIDGDAACKFPARLKWLAQELGNPWKIDLSGCQNYFIFFSKVAALRASIVFSSYYLSNPNSAFGHTFMRLSRYVDRQETEMLDYGINYSAESKGANPLAYVYNGLTGKFKGKFAAMPYYYKVREYSDYEFRDLWSYELKLDMKQVLEMVDHIWELSHTYFDYFYFLENCSYHLLSIIEVVMPEKELTSQYSVFAIPADTIRLLKKEGIIGEGKRRESTYSRLMRLSKDELKSSLTLAAQMVEEPSKTPELVKDLEVTNAAKTLDIAIEAFDYRYSKKILSDDPATRKAKAYILETRAVNPVITADAPVTSLIYDSPAEGHAPTRYSLFQGLDHQQGKVTQVEWRAAMHDLLDPLRGSLKEAQLEMGKVTLSYKQKDYDEDDLRLEEVTILSLKNYPSQSFWASPHAWELETGVRQLNRLDCFDCPAFVQMGSIGNAIQLAQDRFLMSVLLNGELGIQSYYKSGFRLGLGPKIVTRVILGEKWTMGLESTYHVDGLVAGKTEMRHHFRKDLSLFLRFQASERDEVWAREGGLGLQYFH